MAVSKNNFKGNDLPVDPDVKIPAAVRAAAEAADAAQRAAYNNDTAAPAPAPADTPPPSDGIKIAEPPAPATPPSMVTQVGNEPPQPQPEPAPVNEDTWEHKYKSLHGRFLQSTRLNEDLTNRVQALEGMIESVTAERAQPPAPAATVKQLLTQKELDEFGPEMIDVIKRGAMESVSPEVEALRQQMQLLERRLGGTEATVVKTSKASMMDALDVQMPDWRQINLLPEFKAWLALPDPYFGVIRHGALTEAFEKCDTPRVLAFFKGFVSELAATTPAGDTGQPAVTPPARPTLEDLAAPGRARATAGAQPPAEKQIITTADINAFYDARRKGLYRGREEEFAKLEQELFQAQREGRVRTTT